MQIGQQDIDNWKQDLNKYQYQRKHERLQIIYDNARNAPKEMKPVDAKFNPILQQYQQKEKDDVMVKTQENKYKSLQDRKTKTLEKYDREYNIVNLDKKNSQKQTTEGLEFLQTKNLIVPSFRDYNIISNNKVDPKLYKNIKALKEEKISDKVVEDPKKRDFNIISNMYKQDHDSKFDTDQASLEQKWKDKYAQARNFDPIRITYYNNDKEKKFQEDLVVQQQNHGKDAVQKLPPSLRFRESIIQDPSKPVPEEIKKIDEMKKNAKKRYELRHQIETEYHDKDIDTQNRNLQRKLNRLHEGKYTEEKKKGFDIITLDKLDIDNFEKFMFKKPNPTIWEQIQITGNQDQFNNLNQQVANSDILDSEISKQQQQAKTTQEFFQGKKIQPPRQRVFEPRQLKDNDQQLTQLLRQGSSSQQQQQKKSRTQTMQNSANSNNNNNYNTGFKVPIQISSNDINSLSKKKSYLNDPNNATLSTQEPIIVPKFSQPVKRIQTSGFVMKPELYAQQ